MPSIAKAKFDENKKDLDQLWSIHQEVSGQGAGRKHGVDVLNRAAIVFISACWESYVEDLAKEAFDWLLGNVPNALAIPTKVRDHATKPMFDQKNSIRVWDLADSGWRALLISHKTITIENWIDGWHSPKSAKVKSLFEDLLGIGNIPSHWHWQGMSAVQAAKKLDGYIKIRGAIAHRTEHNETVYKNWGSDFLGHVELLVSKTEAATEAHLLNITGSNPW
jgi:hypothetical protein